MSDLEELEVKVACAVAKNKFIPLTKQYDSVSLWIATHNAAETIRYHAAEQLFGRQKEFQLHGMGGLTYAQGLQVNQSVKDTLEKFDQAHDYLAKTNGGY